MKDWFSNTSFILSKHYPGLAHFGSGAYRRNTGNVKNEHTHTGVIRVSSPPTNEFSGGGRKLKNPQGEHNNVHTDSKPISGSNW